MDLKQKLRHVMDFPKKGISFKDITTLIKDPEALRYTINRMVTAIDEHIDVDMVGRRLWILFYCHIVTYRQIDWAFLPHICFVFIDVQRMFSYRFIHT